MTKSIFDLVKRYIANGMTEQEAIHETERILRSPLPQFIKDKIHEEVM